MSADTAATGPESRVRVFLSWSGERSKALAMALEESIGTLSDRIEPWISDELEPGVEWASALIPQIQQARFAILCLTNRNMTAPWIAFETGAYYTSPLREGVIPFLLDIDADELPFPIGLFQSLKADWKGTKALLTRLGRLVDLDADAVEERMVTGIWPQLHDRIDAIRRIDFDGTRTDEPGHWMNVANAFFLGHDLRWTMDELRQGGVPDDVKHGLRQVLHQADELGLSTHDHFLILARQATEVLGLPGEAWTPEVRDKLKGCLKDALERFGGLIISRQPGYRPYPPDNQDSWLAIQADGRA
jgi:hypothetical protein